MANLYDKASFIFTANAYSASRLFSIKPTTGNGDLTFSRASARTRVNSSGVIQTLATDIPALNYSSSLSCPTFLTEPQRTNFFWPSDTGSNASNIVSASNDWGIGFVNKNTLYNTGAAGAVYYTSSPMTIVTGSTYIISCYVKIVDGQAGTPVFGPTANSQGYFNIAGTSITGDSSYRKIPLGNNIWRVVASGSGTGGVQNTGFLRWTMNRTGSNGTGSIEVTGLQVESGSGTTPFETSYIPTTTGAVTRAGDSISLSNIYTNGFISLTGGTWFVNFKNNTVISGDGGTTGMFLGSSPTNPTTGDSLHFRSAGASGRHKLWKTSGSSTSTVYDTTSDNCKIAMTWNGSFLNVFENGTRVITSASFGATSSLQNLAIPTFAGRPFNIDSMALFPTALSDAECIALTT